jgi:photosystem II stability/assembly factor-like uncharacterized protein
MHGKEGVMGKRLFAVAATLLILTAAPILLFYLAERVSQDLLGAALAAPLSVPTVMGVDPVSAPNDLDTSIVITGSDFAAVLSGTIVITPPAAYLGGTALDDVIWVGATTLSATVPWGMDPGVYTLTVVNPDGESGGLPDAFTVTQGIGVWTTGGPYGGQIGDLVLHPITPTTVYALVDWVGVFASYDAAANWEPILRDDWPSHLSIDVGNPDVMYCGGDGYLLRSMDGGSTWEHVTPPAEWTPAWKQYRPAAHPTLPGVVYTGKRAPDEPDEEGGLYWSDDHGAAWVTRTNGMTDTHVTDIAFHPEDPNTMLVGTQNGNIFLSNDGGLDWIWIARPGSYIERLYFNPYEAHEAWTIAEVDPAPPPYLYKSTDPDLVTWTPVTVTAAPGTATPDAYYPPVNSLAFISDTIWVAAAEGFTSTDGGATWTPVTNPELPYEGTTAFASHPATPDVIYAGYLAGTWAGRSGGGVFKSSDGGDSWREMNEGLAGVVPYALAVSPDDLDTIYAQTSERGLLKSNNGGHAWQWLDVWRGHMTSPRVLAIDPFTATRIYLGDVCVGALCLRISEDAGGTWRQVTTTLPITLNDLMGNMTVLAPHPRTPGRILAGVTLWSTEPAAPDGWLFAGIYASDEYGEHWEHLWPPPTQSFSPVLELVYDAVDSDLVYAGTEAGLWKSTDGGTSWQAISISGVLPPVGIESLATHPFKGDVVYVRTLSFADTQNPGGVLHVSEDAGETWTRLGEETSDGGLVFAPTRPVATLYTACDRGFCRSTDGGQSWGQIDGAPRPTAMNVGVDGERMIVYIATPGGVVSSEARMAQLSGAIPGRGSVLGGGVYRLTTVLPDRWVYLPLICRGYAP